MAQDRKMKEKFLKLKQNRDFLRSALQSVEPKLAQLQFEKLNLHKAYETELRRAEVEKEAKEKEMSVRAGLEKEVSNLKSEIASLQKNNVSGDQNYDGDVTVLQTRVSELEGETARLTQLLEEARQKGDFEKKKVAEENIKSEKSRQNEKVAKLKESNQRSGFENEILDLKSEVAALKESKGTVDLDEDGEVILLRTRVLDGQAEIRRLIEILDNEKKNGEMDKKKVLAEKNKFEDAWKIEVEARSKDSLVRAGLENDISDLKSQIDLLLAQRDLRDQEVVLQTCVSEAEVGSNRLKVLLDQEKKRANSDKEKFVEASKIETETRSKESPTRGDSENENLVLKSEIGSLLAERSTKNQDEGGELKNHVSEAENNLFDELLDQEKKKDDAERKKAKEAWKVVTEAKSKESSLRASLENENFNLKSKITSLLTERDSKNQEGSQIVSFQTRVLEGEAENNLLKELLGQECKKAISEKKRAKSEKKKAKAWKLEAEAKLKETASLENEIFKLKSEKKKAEEERRLADIGRNFATECRPSLEASWNEVNELRAKLVSEKSKVEEAHRKIEVEKQVADRGKERAELEMEKAEQWKKRVEEEKKKLMDEKHHSGYLFCKLEEERQRIELLEKEVQELILARKTENDRRVTFNVNRIADEELMLLTKELKLEKMHVKHAKRVAKFEKKRNNLLGQELHRLKQEFSHFGYRLKALDGCFSSGSEGIGAQAEINNSLNSQRSNVNTKFPGKETTSLYGKSENETAKPCYTSIDWFDHFRSAVECSVPLVDGRESAKKPISDISSTLGSLIGESVRNKLQDSAVYSTSTSFSGRLSAGSQENNIFSISRPDNLKKNSKQGSIFSRLSAGSTNPRINGNPGILAENTTRTPVHRDMDIPCLSLNKHGDINVVGRGTAPKRKRLPDEADYLCRKLRNFPTQIEEKRSAVTDSLIQENNMPTTCCSQMGGKSNASGDGRCQTTALLGDTHVTDSKYGKKGKVSLKQKHLSESGSKLDVNRLTNNLEPDVT